MNKQLWADEKISKAWAEFTNTHQLSEQQQKQFARYLELLIAKNEVINLTTIIDPLDIISYHFHDSLCIGQYIDFTQVGQFLDIGSGAGFPGIPLLIKYPAIAGILLEVIKKKLAFLEEVITELDLAHATLCDLDWRTFLRKTDLSIALMVSRASLHTDELMRVFKPSCPYNKALLVYWAGKEWVVSDEEKPFLVKEVEYTVGHKKEAVYLF